MFQRSSDYDHVQDVPFVRMASNPAKLDRCVGKVKRKGGVDNAYAVCKASLGS